MAQNNFVFKTFEDDEKAILKEHDYNQKKGWNRFGSSVIPGTLGWLNRNDYRPGREFVEINGYKVPTTNMGSFSQNKMEEVLLATKRKGRKLTDEEFKDIVGDVQFENKAAWYNATLDINQETFGFGSGEVETEETNMKPDKNPYDMITDYNSKSAQDYLANMDSATSEQESVYNQSLEAAELESYKQIGMMQQQLESQIAQQRQQALRSGTTSAQLAVQSLNQMFAAQQGAAQIGMQTGQKRTENSMMFANQRAQTRMGLGNLIEANKSGLSQVGAQNYAAYSAWDAMANAPANYAKSFQQGAINYPQGMNLYKDPTKP